MEKNEEMDNEISLVELFQIIWKKKILIGAITLGSAILLTLVFVLMINPSSKKHSVKFELDFIGIENGVYPSNNEFNYSNIISESNLLLAGDNLLNDESVHDMIANGGISINEKKQEGYLNSYEIVVNSGYFKSESDANKFLEKLVENSKNKIETDINASIKYGYDLDNFDFNTSYETQLNLLDVQLVNLNNTYELLLQSFLNNKVDNSTLLASQAAYNKFYISEPLSDLRTELVYKNYIYWDATDGHELQTELIEKEAQLRVLKDELTYLEDYVENNLASAPTEVLAVYHEKIASKLKYIAVIEVDIVGIKHKISLNDPATATADYLNEKSIFENNIKEKYNEILKYTTDLENTIKKVYLDDSNYTFNIANITSSQTNIVLIGAFFLIASGGVTCVVFIAIDFFKRNKEKKELNAKA